MGSISKELSERAGYAPLLQLFRKKIVNGEERGVEALGPMHVKFIEEKLKKDLDFETNQEVEKVWYFFEHEGERKVYKVSVKDRRGNLHYLIPKFREVEPGTELVLEGKRHKGGWHVAVQVVGELQAKFEVDDEEIPVVEEEEHQPTQMELDEAFGKDPAGENQM